MTEQRYTPSDSHTNCEHPDLYRDRTRCEAEYVQRRQHAECDHTDSVRDRQICAGEIARLSRFSHGACGHPNTSGANRKCNRIRRDDPLRQKLQAAIIARAGGTDKQPAVVLGSHADCSHGSTDRERRECRQKRAKDDS